MLLIVELFLRQQMIIMTSTDPEKSLLVQYMAQRVVGITTGTTTTIDFPEGTGSPFDVEMRFSDCFWSINFRF